GPLVDDGLDRAIAFVQRTGEVDHHEEAYAVQLRAAEMAALNAHTDQPLTVAMRRSRIEVTRTAESTVAVLDPVALKTPFSLWHVISPFENYSSNPLGRFRPAGRPPSIPESHPRAAAPDSPAAPAARPPRS